MPRWPRGDCLSSSVCVLLLPPADRVGLEGSPAERASGLELEAVLREDCVGS